MGPDGGRGSWGGVIKAACATAVAGALAVGLAVGSAAGWLAAATMVTAVAVTLGTIGWWPRTRPRLTAAAAIVTAVSAAGTLLTKGAGEDSPLGLLMLVEFAAVIALTFVVVRFAPDRQAAPLVPLLAVTASTMILRVRAYDTFLEAFGQCAFMGLGAIGAIVVGGYLRALDVRRLNAVRAARRGQRLELARDLHDFVAHDVSGIVVLAQAAQLVGAEQPERLMPLLHQIESAGLQALRSMDRTVHMLGDADPDAAVPAGAVEDRPRAYGLEDITDVVDRFRASGRADVRLELEVAPEAMGEIPREVAGTAHRMVVESLTNIRRHARTAAAVRVRVALERPGGSAPALAVSVVNGAESLSSGSGDHLAEGGRQGGMGLVGLTERVEALGGTLSAGPDAGGGWRTAAVLPLGDGGSTPR